MTRCKDLFAEAAGLLPSDRTAMLDRACSDDPALRMEVERLLAAFDGAGDFLESSAIERSSISRLLDRTGTRIGNYIVREPLGEGGMGVVWKAEQTAPVCREVALKLLKPGTESRQVLARFETERRALERMEHPNIARVLDAGSTESGRPYVVMELVRGVAITTFCDARRMSIVDRLGLFVLVCRAVQHAHTKGIIHRDLKPSNILVADDGRTVTPKVIDFSIARAIDRSADETSYTRNLLLLGTPSYVSPEQAVGSADTDTRTDIYSLGAVLYELFCGVPPFGEQELSRLATDEFLRRLQQDDPVRPSRRLATLDDLAAIADARRSTPNVLRRCLAGDLDRIVMKALDKDPARRYETAAALADDLERFSRHEPVTAVRPSAGYHALKFARRHRAGIVAAGLILVSILSGTAVATWQAVRAAASEARYRREAYISDVNLADDALRSDDPQRMKSLLARHIPVDGEKDLRGFSWHYLYRHCTAPGMVIDRFDGPAYYTCLSPAPERRWLAASGADGTVRLYDTRSWKRTKVIHTGQKEVNGVAFAPDGSQMASAGDDGNVKIWDVASGRLMRSISVFPEDPAFQVVYTAVEGTTLLAVCGPVPIIKLFDAATGQPRGELVGPESEIEAIAAFPDHRLAAASDDGVPRVWDLAKRELIFSWPDKGFSRLTSAAFSPDGRLIAFGTLQQNYVLCRSHSSRQPQTFPIRDDQPEAGNGTQCLAFGPDGDELITADFGGAVRVSRFDAKDQPHEDLADGQYPRWAAHDGQVYSIAVTDNGKDVITAGADGTLSVWRPYEAPDAWTVSAKADPVVDIAVGPEGLVVVAGPKTIDLYHIQRGHLQHVADQSGDKFRVVEISSDGRTVLAGTENGSLKAWVRRNSGFTNAWERIDPDASAVISLALSPDGRHVAGILSAPDPSSPRVLCLIDAATGDLRRTDSVPSASEVAFSPDGTTLAVDRNNDVLLYDVPSLSMRHALKGHTQTVEAVVFSPDGRRVASGGSDRYIILWDTESGTIAERWLVQGAGIRSLAFGPRGETILSTGDDMIPRITDLRTGRLLLRFPRLAEEHWPMQFLPDGQMVVGRNASKGFYVFDGRPLAADERPASSVQPRSVK